MPHDDCMADKVNIHKRPISMNGMFKPKKYLRKGTQYLGGEI